MMNFISKKTYSFLLVLISLVSFAQSVPPPPDNPESGDIGAPAAPIDAHTLILFFVATIIITFVTLKQRQRILE